MDLSFSHRKSERSVNNISLSPQTQAVLRLGINRLTRFQAGEGLGQWTVDAGISRGMPWLDTNRDPADLPREAARYRFTKLELSASVERPLGRDRKSTRLNSSHLVISYAVFCLKKKSFPPPHRPPRRSPQSPPARDRRREAAASAAGGSRLPSRSPPRGGSTRRSSRRPRGELRP